LIDIINYLTCGNCIRPHAGGHRKKNSYTKAALNAVN